MILKEKIIVFLICDIPDLSDKAVDEMEQMVAEGARIRAYLVRSHNRFKVRSSLKEKLSSMGVSWEEIILSGEEDISHGDGEKNINESYQWLEGDDFLKEMDLLVAAPCPPWLWKKLVAFRLPERVSLVVAPVGLDAGTRNLIYYLGNLMKKERTYFVPFGPVSLKPGEAEAVSSGERSEPFLSRMELLGETTRAAAGQSQIEPYLLELETLPH